MIIWEWCPVTRIFTFTVTAISYWSIASSAKSYFFIRRLGVVINFELTFVFFQNSSHTSSKNCNSWICSSSLILNSSELISYDDNIFLINTIINLLLIISVNIHILGNHQKLKQIKRIYFFWPKCVDAKHYESKFQNSIPDDLSIHYFKPFQYWE